MPSIRNRQEAAGFFRPLPWRVAQIYTEAAFGPNYQAVPVIYPTGKSFYQRVPLLYPTGKSFDQAVRLLSPRGESFDRLVDLLYLTGSSFR